ncbi:DUF1707 domain-containing protein [Pseudonocardia sp. WMMC193]|uniref:DUF1707 SHOCT-like domain-containing protein n=1 Tax=Pseudonocardia sp. WMMC193 TaxID=2911965 RepID=UPI001F35994C|nr:DUF1707 domain-containing protein [Pseudonocardia sp. WMMC193]MCF7550254.1 DUF1707 domain-containing protein [Pseudonocardia sp. WMMC193]
MTAALPDDLEPRRRAAQQQLERAVGEGRLTLDEFTDRAGAVWAAGSGAEIERTTADLPVPVVGGTKPGRSALIGVIGDITRRGRWSLRRRTTAVLLIGDVDLDLRGAVVEQGTEPITVDTWSVLGDTVLTVPEGVEVEVGGFTLLGDRQVDLAPVPRVPGTPVVRVRVWGLIGDVTVRSAR